MLRNAADLSGRVQLQLERHANTSSVVALRMVTMQRAMVMVGVVGLFEGLLQVNLGWNDPRQELERYLKAQGADDLVEKLQDVRDAVNALKHGDGPSYQKLLAKKAELGFAVKDEGEPFFNEGDLAQISTLVNTTEQFATLCLDTIELIVARLRADGRMMI